MRSPCRLARAPTRAVSLDDLIGADEQRLRHGEAECFGSLKIDYQLDPRWLLDRQISGPGAFEDLSGIYANVAVGGREARSITDQPAGSGELAPLIDRRKAIACCQRHKLLAATGEERIGALDERAGRLLDESRESGVDLT